MTYRKKLAPFTIYAEVTPLREDLEAWDMAIELSGLLRQLTCADGVTHGHIADHRWDLQDDAAQAPFGPFPCAAHLTVVEASELLEVTPATVRRMVRSGVLDAERKVDRSYRIPKASVTAATACASDSAAKVGP